MDSEIAVAAVVAFRNQILVAEGTNSYWIEWTERGNRLFCHAVDVTDEKVDDFRRRGSLARMILNAPPVILPIPDFDTSNEDLD